MSEEIKQLLAKVVSGEELSEEERSALGAIEIPDLSTANKSAAQARIRMTEQQKQLQDLQAQLEQQTEALEEAKAGGSKAEQAERKLQKLVAKQEELMKQLDQERQQHASTRRSSVLGTIDIPWMDGVSQKYKQTVLEEAFADIDTDDLSDSSRVAEIVANVVKEQSAFVKAPVKSGAGTSAGESLNGVSSGQSGTDWQKPIDWYAIRDQGGPEGVQKVLDKMWDEPATK